MGSWEVVTSAFVFLIGIFFAIGFTIPKNNKYVAFKLLFLWLGFTLIIPFLAILQIISTAHIESVGKIFGVIVTAYLPIYIFICWVLYLAFFRDVIIFFKNTAKGFTGSGEEEVFTGNDEEE